MALGELLGCVPEEQADMILLQSSNDCPLLMLLLHWQEMSVHEHSTARIHPRSIRLAFRAEVSERELGEAADRGILPSFFRVKERGWMKAQ